MIKKYISNLLLKLKKKYNSFICKRNGHTPVIIDQCDIGPLVQITLECTRCSDVKLIRMIDPALRDNIMIKESSQTAFRQILH